MWDMRDRLLFLIGCDLDLARLPVYSSLWSGSRSCAWSLPWACFDISGRAKGVGSRQCLGDARASCHAIAAALIFLSLSHVFVHQFWDPSAFTNQGLQNLTVIFVSYGSWPLRQFITRAVFFQWGKSLQCKITGFGRKIQQRLTIILLQISVH